MDWPSFLAGVGATVLALLLGAAYGAWVVYRAEVDVE